jgi:hypothetical protein
MLNNVILSVIMLNIVMLSVTMVNIGKLSAVVLHNKHLWCFNIPACFALSLVHLSRYDRRCLYQIDLQNQHS